MKTRHKTYLFILILSFLSFHLFQSLLLTPRLTFPDTTNQLLIILRYVPLNLVVTVLSDHSFEQVSDIDFEVVRVLVTPVDKSGDELREGRSDDGRREGNDRDFDETNSGFDDLAIRRSEENDKSFDEFSEVRLFEFRYQREVYQLPFEKETRR